MNNGGTAGMVDGASRARAGVILNRINRGATFQGASESSWFRSRSTGNNMTSVPLDFPLRCRCGHVRGVATEVAPSAGFRFVCYCMDCQAFARFLEPPDVLDAAGGTDIFQMPMGRVKLIEGADALRCLRFSSKVSSAGTPTVAGPRSARPLAPASRLSA
jgi:hypothetical protein